MSQEPFEEDEGSGLDPLENAEPTAKNSYSNWIWGGVILLLLIVTVFQCRSCAASAVDGLENRAEAESNNSTPEDSIYPGEITVEDLAESDPVQQEQAEQLAPQPKINTVLSGTTTKILSGDRTIEEKFYWKLEGTTLTTTNEGEKPFNRTYHLSGMSETLSGSTIILKGQASYESVLVGQTQVSVSINILETALEAAQITQITLGDNTFFNSNGGSAGTKTLKYRTKTHIIQPNETLQSIAERYGMSIASLKARNPKRIYQNNSIYAGEKLTVVESYYE